MKSRIYNKSYVISVSYGSGCYRHIKISGKATLEALSEAILNAFEFDNDHLHAFFMDNRAWSDEECYSSPYADDGCPDTDRCKLQFMNLEAGKKFLYVFDFGDDWEFQCKVLKVLDEDTKKPEIIRSKGEPPEQYPDYDEYYDYEDDDYEDDEEYEYEELKELPVPVPDELYDAALRFKSTKLWKKIFDSDLFAVKLSNGETGYCSVTGRIGEHFALIMYIGEKGLFSYYLIAHPQKNEDEQKQFEHMVSQECIQCCFDNKDNLHPADYSSIKAYADAHNIRFRGANSYPFIIRAKPFYSPWFVTDENEFTLMKEALEAGIDVAEKLKDNTPEQLGFDGSNDIPFLVPSSDGFEWSTIRIPDKITRDLPSPVLGTDTAKKLKELKKVNKWECELIHVQMPVQESPEVAPFFPAILLTIENRNDYVISSEPIKDYYANADAVLDSFAEKLISYGRIPKTIAVADERTEYLLSKMCEECGIELKRVNKLTKLVQVRESIKGPSFGSKFERFMSMVSMFEEMSEKDMSTMPPETVDMFRVLISENLFSTEFENRFYKLFGK